MPNPLHPHLLGPGLVFRDQSVRMSSLDFNPSRTDDLLNSWVVLDYPFDEFESVSRGIRRGRPFTDLPIQIRFDDLRSGQHQMQGELPFRFGHWTAGHPWRVRVPEQTGPLPYSSAALVARAVPSQRAGGCLMMGWNRGEAQRQAMAMMWRDGVGNDWRSWPRLEPTVVTAILAEFGGNKSINPFLQRVAAKKD
jgi:hypothetical protein